MISAFETLQREHPHKLSDRIVKERLVIFRGQLPVRLNALCRVSSGWMGLLPPGKSRGRPASIQAEGHLWLVLRACCFHFWGLAEGHRSPSERRIIEIARSRSTENDIFFSSAFWPETPGDAAAVCIRQNHLFPSEKWPFPGVAHRRDPSSTGSIGTCQPCRYPSPVLDLRDYSSHNRPFGP